MRTKLLTSLAGAAVVAGLALGVSAAANAASSVAFAGDYAYPLPLGEYNVSSEFGLRCPEAIGSGVWHGGYDLSADRGTPILSIADGVVDEVDTEGTPTLTIASDDDDLTISYSHMDDPEKYVKVGDQVAAGQHIADVSDAGIATGPHLHLEVTDNGEAVDPAEALLALGLNLPAHAHHVFTEQHSGSCDVFTTAPTVLLSSTDLRAKALRILPRDTPLSLEIADDGSGLVKVHTEDGVTGFVHDGRVSALHAKHVAREGMTFAEKDRGVLYRIPGHDFLFSDPAPLYLSGVLAVMHPMEIVETTGRRQGDLIEVDYGALRGWVDGSGGFVPVAATGSTARGEVDTWHVHRGVLDIVGWALDSNSPADAAQIRVTVDGEPASGSVERTERPELQAEKRNQTVRTDLGFRLHLELEPGSHQVTVTAVGSAGDQVLFDRIVVR